MYHPWVGTLISCEAASTVWIVEAWCSWVGVSFDLLVADPQMMVEQGVGYGRAGDVF
jgi:hypothetical protein